MSSKSVPVKSPRKLIEVALPLDKINAAAAVDRKIRHGHPSALHLWWSRKPLAAARAILFAQLVNDPGYQRHLNRGVNKAQAALERDRLFAIMEELVKWENSANESVLARARVEIQKSWQETCDLNRNHPEAGTLFDPAVLPGFHDPFSGGGSIPLEAQRLGLQAFASDLNPVAVTISRATIDFPSRYAGQAPVGPHLTSSLAIQKSYWPAASGLSEDVKRYGGRLKEAAQAQIGQHYPKVAITQSMVDGIEGSPDTARPDLALLVGQEFTVIAWLWARTVKSPNPAYSAIDVPLISTYTLSSKAGKEAYIQPLLNGREYSFTVKLGPTPEPLVNGTQAARGANFRCILSGVPISTEHIRTAAKSGAMGTVMKAIVADGPKGRLFLPVQSDHIAASLVTVENDLPDLPIPQDPRAFTPILYGFTSFRQLFSDRQLLALKTFSDLVPLAIKECETAAGGLIGYGNAVGTYLALLVDQMANHSSSFCGWNHPNTQMRSVFSMQALAMSWDFAEVNVFSESSGSFHSLLERQVKAFEMLGGQPVGYALQADAGVQTISHGRVVSTDPPYYDIIPYGDLSDFFYLWLRRSLRSLNSDVFATVSVPKDDELIVSPHRNGGKVKAAVRFQDGMAKVLRNLCDSSHPAFPITLYYASKQTSAKHGTSDGWTTFLDAVFEAGYAIEGTWPLRTEGTGRMRENDSNALASTIVLVCRRREADAATISRAQFLRELRATLPEALTEMTRGGNNSPVAPVDLSQAIIGPGMGIFSRYKAVLEADGTPMSVATALQLINRFLADDDFDPETQVCLQWFETNFWKEGLYGQADVAARAKGTGVDALARAGVLRSGGGKVQLMRPADLADKWHPERGNQTPVWEALHHLIHALNAGGEQAAGRLLAAMPSVSGPVRTLSYRLYTMCERQKLADDARTYNELIGSWASIEVAAQEYGYVETQADLFQR